MTNDSISLLRTVWHRSHPDLELRVSPHDDVFRFHGANGRDPVEALGDYLSLGSEILGAVEQATAACGVRWRDVGAWLDCGCGHGRVTRFALQHVPRERLVVCDRVPDAVAFHRECFGIAGVTELAELGDARFDLITAMAMFGNLPEAIFVPLLSELVRRLRPGGVLVLSTESPEDLAGFHYHAQSESSVLAPDVYGASRCSPRWFESQARSLPGVSFVRRGRLALDGIQDVWVIGRERAGDDSPLAIVSPPRIEIDAATVDRDGRISVSGWIADGRKRPAARIDVLGGALEIQPARVDRPDVAAYLGESAATASGFAASVVVQAGRWPRHVVVVANDELGRKNARVRRVAPVARVRTPTPEQATVLERQRRGREVLAYGGLFAVCEAEVHDTGLYPHLAARAEGCRVWDASGREYVDWFLGWGPMLLGHRHAAVEAAIERQLRVAPALPLMHDLEIEVAERLSAMIPCAERVAFGKNGSDVTLAAVRVARAVTGREIVVSCGYHGFHDWNMVQYAWCAGVPSVLREDIRSFPYNDVEALQRTLEESRGRVAAIIMEPTANELPRPGFLESVKRLAREHGAILIFDEMVTGFRLARGGAQELYGVVPDLATFGKALANGLPLSALTGRADIMAALPRVGFGLTYRGELLSLAAATACLDIFAREPVAERVTSTGELMRARFAQLARARGVEAVLQGFPGRMSFTFAPENGITGAGLRALFVEACVRGGVLTNGMLLPSYALDAASIETTLATLDEALATVHTAASAGMLEPFLDQPVSPTYYEAG